jgi:hypothetical protein
MILISQATNAECDQCSGVIRSHKASERLKTASDDSFFSNTNTSPITYIKPK